MKTRTRTGLHHKSLKDIFNEFGVSDTLSLFRLYVRYEQPLFKNGGWDYNDERLAFNKIKASLESLPDAGLNSRDLMWKREILWFWHHHAISIALSKGDMDLARTFADRAIVLQGRGHPNKITRLLWHLVHGRVRHARRWFREGVKRPDRGTARAVLGWYEQGYFSPVSVRMKP